MRGETVSVQGYRIRVKPKSPPPPIYLAALSPESMRLVGEIADGWLPYLLPKRGFAESASIIADAARAAGRAGGAVTIAPLVLTAVSDDGDSGREAARHHIAFYLGAMGPHYRAFVARFGFGDEVERVRVAWAERRHADARRAVTDEMIAELAVAGTPGECRRQLAELRAAGVDLPILFFPGTCSNRMVELALESMGTQAGVSATGRPEREHRSVKREGGSPVTREEAP